MLFCLTLYTEPKDLAAAILGDPNTRVIVSMNSPVSLHCYAWGWPRPFVTWWRGDRMLPLSSEIYEQDSEYSLLIRTVTLPILGEYTCQAFNAIGKAASWSVTLQAVGPVYNIRPEYEEYMKFLVEAPRKPEKPRYPHKPNATRTPDYHTYGPGYVTRQSHVTSPSPIGFTTSAEFGASFRGEPGDFSIFSIFPDCIVGTWTLTMGSMSVSRSDGAIEYFFPFFRSCFHDCECFDTLSLVCDFFISLAC